MKSKLSKDVEIPESFLFLNFSWRCLPTYITHIVILNYPKKHKRSRDNSEKGVKEISRFLILKTPRDKNRVQCDILLVIINNCAIILY